MSLRSRIMRPAPFDRDAEVAIVPFRGCRFFASRDNKVEAALRAGKDRYGVDGYDRLNFSVVESLVGEGDICFDVGANVGVYSCVFGRLSGDAGRVHAFEPATPIRSKLRRNLALNGLDMARVNPFGLGASEEERTFFEVKPGTYRGGISSFVANENTHGTESGSVVERTVRVRRLDDYVAEAGVERIRILKIDVEGFEAEVLRGGAETLSTHRPFVLFEYDHGRHSGELDAMRAIFEAAGYEGLEPYANHGALGFRRWAFDRVPRERNLLMVP